MPKIKIIETPKFKSGGKHWIQGAIKHPGRCTPGSPNYDCPKGSPQWNLAQRFKHGDLHKHEDGGTNPGGTNTYDALALGSELVDQGLNFIPNNNYQGNNMMPSQSFRPTGKIIGQDAAKGAGIGATIGSFFGPGPGTAVGAAIGTGIGAIVGGFEAHKENKDKNIYLNNLHNSNKPIYQPSINPYGSVYKMGGNNNPLSNIYNNSNDIIQYNSNTHESGGDQAINHLGLPVDKNAPSANSLVEKQENSWKNYIFSDTSGIDKNGIPTDNEKKVKTTFAALAKRIDKKLGGKNDIISENTKKIQYMDLISKNEHTLDMSKQKEINNMMKKGGNNIPWKYAPGGPNLPKINYVPDYSRDPNDPTYNQIIKFPTPASYSGVYDPANNYYNPGLVINTTPTASDNTKIAGNNSLFIPNNSPTAFKPGFTGYNNTSSKETNPTSNKPDYLSLGLSLIPLMQSADALFSKSHNLHSRVDNSVLNDINNIPTEPDYTQAYNRNLRSLNAANRNAQINTPGIANSILANNLATKLNADNAIASNYNNQKMQALTNKQSLLAQTKMSLNQLSNLYNQQYNTENLQDKAKRSDIFYSGLNNAASNLNTLRNQNIDLNALRDILTYYTIDQNGNIIRKKNSGAVFSE